MNNNLFKYIKEYGDITIEEKPVTEVDILIFSQIPYLDLSNIFADTNSGMKLSCVWEIAREKNINKNIIMLQNIVKIMDAIYKKSRYRDLILKNYVYVLTKDTQFGAISIIVPNDYIYVAFEGTDAAVCGWKEDFKLTYVYPTESQKLASKYLNSTIKYGGSKVVACGHSKGGNLALVGAMNTNILKKPKIKKIYSFDGPGLRKKEINSLNYKYVKNKLVNIIPNSSLVGVLLEQENVNVIKSKGIGLQQHYVTNWIVDNDELKPASQDKGSKRLDECINRWLAKYNYKEREEIVEGIFSIFDDAGIEDFHNERTSKIEIITKLINSVNTMSKETRDVIIESLKLLFTDINTDIVNDSKIELQKFQEEVKQNIEKYFGK